MALAKIQLGNSFDRDMKNAIQNSLNELYDEYTQAGLNASEAHEKAVQAVTESVLAKEDASVAKEMVQQIIDGEIDTGALNTNIEERLKQKEAEYAPKLNSVSQQLAEIPQLGINVTAFGAVGDRTTDDRQAVQNAIDYLESRGGGTIFFPLGFNFSVQSTHPDYPNAGLVVRGNNIKLLGINHTQIWADAEMDYLIYFPQVGFRIHSFSMEGLRLEGGQRCDVGIKSDDFLFRSSFTDCYVHNFKEKGMEANVFTTKFERCIFRQNKQIGVDLNSHNMPGTSVVFIDHNCSENEIGYKLTYVNYSNFISSFGEYSDIVFDLDGCNSISFNGCGAEHISQVLRVKEGSGIELGFFYLGEMHYNGVPANDYIFDFKNVSSCHFGGVNRKETLQEDSKMVRFLNCRDVTFKYGRIDKNLNQIDFVGTQATDLTHVNHSTTDQTYYIDPVNGHNYSDYVYHGTHPDFAFRSWWKFVEVLPKNINHRITVVLMGDLTNETMELKGIVVSDLLQISGEGRAVKGLDIKGCIGDINIRDCQFTDEVSIRNSQGTRLSNLTCDNLEVRYSSGLLIESSEVNSLLRLRNGSTAQSINNTGTADVHANASTIYAFGTEPSGQQRDIQGGRIFRQE